MGRFSSASTFEELLIFVASLLEKMLINPISDVTDKDAMINFQPFDLLFCVFEVFIMASFYEFIELVISVVIMFCFGLVPAG